MLLATHFKVNLRRAGVDIDALFPSEWTSLKILLSKRYFL